MGKELVITLEQILKEKNINQKELTEMINVVYHYPDPENTKKTREAAISELKNNQRKSINKELIERIAVVLEINDVTKFFKFVDK